MIQGGEGDEGTDGVGRPLRFRDRHRQARHREFLEAARRIMTSEGGSALTMQRVTDAVGSSTGGIYVYFPSKDALVAELQREAIETLRRSYAQGQELLGASLAEAHADAADGTLARVVASARFWFDAMETVPSDVALARNLLTPSGATEMLAANAEAERALPALRALLDDVGGCCTDAVAASALRDGNATERAVVLISSVTVVLLTTKLGRLDTGLFDGRRLATQLVHDLVTGWGADPERLSRAEAHVASFAEQSSLAPAVDEG